MSYGISRHTYRRQCVPVHLLTRDGPLYAAQMQGQTVSPGHFYSPYSHIFLSTQHKQQWILILLRFFFSWNTYAYHKHLRPLTEEQLCVTDSVATEFKAKYRTGRKKGTSCNICCNKNIPTESSRYFSFFPSKVLPERWAPEPKVFEESSKSDSEPTHDSLVPVYSHVNTGL